MIYTIGIIGAVVSGMLLGLLGGGGSILIVPILVYLFELTPLQATGYSLFIVGVSSLFGSFRYFFERNVNFKIALVFGLPSLVCSFLARRFLVDPIPEVLLSINDFHFTKNLALMMALSFVMIGTSYYLIYVDSHKSELERESAVRYGRLSLQGCVVGITTGMVGIGAGFLIVPALIVFARLPMRTAVGTSLLLISVNATFGFLGKLSAEPVHWSFLLPITGVTMLGVFTGIFISKFIPGEKLKPAFGWFILVVGCYIFTRELWESVGM